MRTLRMMAAAVLVIGLAACDKKDDTSASSTGAGTGVSGSGDGVYTTNMVGRYSIQRFERNGSTTNDFYAMKLDLGREGNISLLRDSVLVKGKWVYDPESNFMDITTKENTYYGRLLASKLWTVKLSDGQYVQMEAPDSVGVKKITLRKESNGTVIVHPVPVTE